MSRKRATSDNQSSPESELNHRVVIRRAIWASVAFAALVAISAAATFALALRGPEETQTPNLAGEELADAVIALQERGLVPQLQLRYFADPSLKGRVVDQEPAAGSVVRAGRRVTLLVSQGAIVESVADYRGERLSDVQAELQSLGIGSDAVLFIDTVSYVFDESDPNTVIEQDPEPGTTLSGPTGLDLVVSRGPDVERTSLPTFLGLGWEDALQILARDGAPFVFTIEEQPTIGPAGVVVGQSPDPGTEVVVGTPVELAIRDVRAVPDGYSFDIFDRTLPQYAVSVELTAVAELPDGEARTIFTMVHPGGRVAFPYELEYGTSIVLYRYDTEVIRFLVRDAEAEG